MRGGRGSRERYQKRRQQWLKKHRGKQIFPDRYTAFYTCRIMRDLREVPLKVYKCQFGDTMADGEDNPVHWHIGEED